MDKRKERNYFSGKKHGLRLFGLACLLVLLGAAVAFAGTELIASNSVDVGGIEYYAALDGEWQRIDMAKTVPGKETSGKLRYYTTPDALEEIYGKFGFSAKDYAGEALFPHTVAGDSGQIWGDAKPEKTNLGGWKIPLASKDKIYVYYLPKGADYETEGKKTGSFALDSDKGREALKRNMFYSVALSDPDKKLGEEKGEVKYVASGGSYSVTLPAEDGYQWEAVDRRTLAALSGGTKVTKEENENKTVTLTFTNISEPIKIQPVTPANSQLKIVYNAATVNDNLQEMGDSSASIQEAESDGKINKKDSFTFYMDAADMGANVKILAPDSSKALVKVNGSSQGKKFWYNFAGWRVSGTGTILSPDDTTTLQQLQQYEVDGEIQLDAVWKGRNSRNRIDSANFYVNKNCEIADNMSSGAGQIPAKGFTKSLYTAKVDDQASKVTLDSKGAYLLLAPDDENSNAYEVDSQIRQLTENAVNDVSMESFPSDEDVLANLRANYDPEDPIKVDGKVIPKENLTSANFKVRWYSVKYQKSDGWHVDGILVAKAGKVVIRKTIAGGADAATEALKNQDFNISVSHIKDPAANDPEQEDYKLVLKDKKATGADAPAADETGYDSYDESTRTYTWELTVRDYQQYEIEEHNYKLKDFDRSEHIYHIRNNDNDTESREEDETFTWDQYQGPITITANAYADDVPESSYQTVELRNLYVTSSYITLDKLDAFTVNGMENVRFTVSKLDDGETSMPFQLYQRPGNNAYSYIKDDTFTESADGNVIRTDSTGLAFLKLPAGTYMFTEQVPDGYQKNTSAFKIVVENNTGKAGTHIKSSAPCDAKGNAVSGSNDYVSSLEDSSVVMVKNRAEQLTTVTAKANMGNVKADSVQVELWCNGAKLAGSQYTQTLSARNNWTYQWENLPLYTNGDVAQYTLRETQIGDTAYDPGVNGDGYADYVVTYDDCKYREADDGDYNDQASWKDDKGNQHYARHALLAVNNKKYEIPQQYINVDVKISWDDSNDQDGSRPKNVNVKLLDGSGNQAGTEHSLNASDDWKCTFLQLTKLDSDKNEIKYQITDKSFTVPAGYTATVTGNMTDGFTITFKHTPETVTIAGTKVWDDDNNAKNKRPDSIPVNLLANGTKVDSKTVKAGSDGTWGWSFAGKAKYENGKEINYTVSEEAVTDYTPTYEKKDGSYTITNTYTPAGFDAVSSSITDQIDVEKKLTGRTLQDKEFIFDLLEDGAVVATGTNDASGKVTFDKINYTQPGRHTYTLQERQGNAGGVTYDQQTYTITTTVADQGKGNLSVIHVLSAKADAQGALFTNTYEAAPASASISAVKHLTGKDLEDGQFTFQLKDEKGKVVDEAKNGENGVIEFKKLTFDKVGSYNYTVSEVNDKQENIQYDDSEKTVEITVTDNGSGALEATVKTDEELSFTNVYQAKDPSDDHGNNGGDNGNNGTAGSGDNNGNSNNGSAGTGGTDGTNINSGSGAKTGDSTDIALALGLMLIAATTTGILLVRRRLER